MEQQPFRLKKFSYRELVELYEMVRKVPGSAPDAEVAVELYEKVHVRLQRVEAERLEKGLPVHAWTPHTSVLAALGDAQLWDHAGEMEIRDAETGEVLQKLGKVSEYEGRQQLAVLAFGLKLAAAREKARHAAWVASPEVTKEMAEACLARVERQFAGQFTPSSGPGDKPTLYEPGFHSDGWTIAWEGNSGWPSKVSRSPVPGVHAEAQNHWCLALFKG